MSTDPLQDPSPSPFSSVPTTPTVLSVHRPWAHRQDKTGRDILLLLDSASARTVSPPSLVRSSALFTTSKSDTSKYWTLRDPR